MKPEDEYSQLRKKYKELPELKWLENNFDFSFDKEGINPLWQVMISISHKLNDTVKNDIEPLISGSESYDTWIEKRMFTKDERDELSELYRELKAVIWESKKLDIEYSEKDFIDWISDTAKFWESKKEELKKICNKIAKGWKKQKPSEDGTVYHG